MTTEIVHRAPQSVPDKIAYAQALAEADLLPAAYRRKPANVLLAIETAEALGIPPVMAISTIHIVDGKPTASAALISALVRRAGHTLRIQGDDHAAVAQIVRRDDPDYTYESRWDIPRAHRAGLTGKSAWRTYPAAMLKARAITEVCRDACQEALYGIQYTAEELGADILDVGSAIEVTVVGDTGDDTAVCGRDWLAEAHALGAAEQVLALYRDCQAAGELTDDNRAALIARGKALRDAEANPTDTDTNNTMTTETAAE